MEELDRKSDKNFQDSIPGPCMAVRGGVTERADLS